MQAELNKAAVELQQLDEIGFGIFLVARQLPGDLKGADDAEPLVEIGEHIGGQ